MKTNKQLLWNEIENSVFALNYETLRIASNLSFKELNKTLKGNEHLLDQDFSISLSTFSDLFRIKEYDLNNFYYKVRDIFNTQDVDDYILIKNRTIFPPALLNDEEAPLVLYSRGNLNYLEGELLSAFGGHKISYTAKEMQKTLPTSRFIITTTIFQGFNNNLIYETLKQDKPLIVILNNSFYAKTKYSALEEAISETNLLITPFSKAQATSAANSLITNDLLVDIADRIYVGEQGDNTIVYKLVRRARSKNKNIYASKIVLDNKVNLWPRELADYQIVGIKSIKDIKDIKVRKSKKNNSIQLSLL